MSAHEQVETPNWDTKQRCSCGAEYVSRCEMWKHLADERGAENERLREVIEDSLTFHAQAKSPACGVTAEHLRRRYAALASSPSETEDSYGRERVAWTQDHNGEWSETEENAE